MIKIYTNVITRKSYDANGDLFRDGVPNIFYNATDTVMWQLCTATPDIARESGETPDTAWTKCTDYAAYSSIGAFLTADNDYVKRMQGVLTASVSSGSVSSISASIPDAGLDTIPQEGNVTLFDAGGNMEILEYESVAIDGDSCVFTLSEGQELDHSYASGNLMDCVQSVLMQAGIDTQNSDIPNGLFVFQITAASRKLHDLLAYADTRQADVMGLELAIFDVDAENATVTDIERYELDSFTIRSGIADTLAEPQMTTPRQSATLLLVNTLLASGFEVQFSQDGQTDWHDTQTTEDPMDMYYRFRLSGTGGTWSSAVKVPESSTEEAKAWAAGTDDEVAEYGGEHSAQTWAEIMADLFSYESRHEIDGGNATSTYTEQQTIDGGDSSDE